MGVKVDYQIIQLRRDGRRRSIQQGVIFYRSKEVKTFVPVTGRISDVLTEFASSQKYPVSLQHKGKQKVLVPAKTWNALLSDPHGAHT